MPGLIPLMLHQPSGTRNRDSFVLPPQNQMSAVNVAASIREQHKRMASLDSSEPAVKPKGSLKRLSLQVPASLPVLPFTATEWNAAIADIKRHYINRKYRICSTRCADILDNIRPDANIEPAYLIYLNFYAASSAEMLARPLNPVSPYRVRLLNQARQHYSRAADLIQSADDTISQYSRPSSAATVSSSGSLHSPSSSISSRASTEFSSPMTTAHSFEDALTSSLRLAGHHRSPSKKRVTFCDEPIIRPDSPTLGFEDFSLRCASPDVDESLYPTPLQTRTSKQPMQSAMRSSPEPREVVSHPPTPEPLSSNGDDDFSFLRESSIHRYTALLSSLRCQVNSHLASLEADLTPSAGPTAGSRLSFSLPSRAASPVPSAADSEMRALDLKARIERLRASGWQRKRFDPTRYENLRESVLAELA
ncbi:hypothetical protein B0T11DRAFT_17381 [Plectosphaerella cucumerina]|uniref:Uncharacterized protein n=1 Tax=Plectosphaerella cucumerina TaxID=40658 RepID=A0A8K0TTA4_9PEZI|nr:hypothetical protein B0T11DRAFT_17381 [Plectosphaerella cucumerina]